MGGEPSLHLETISGFEPLIEAKRGDAEDFGKRRFGFLCRPVLQSALKLLQDGIFAVPAGTNDEGKAELLTISPVEAMKLREFHLRQALEPGARLFRLGISCHRAGTRRLAGEIGVALDQCQPLL